MATPQEFVLHVKKTIVLENRRSIFFSTCTEECVSWRNTNPAKVLKDAVMQTEKALIKYRLRVFKVS